MAEAKIARQAKEGRRTRRVTTDLAVSVREQGRHGTPTRLLDLSRYGFRIDVHDLAPDSIVWLRLPDAEPQMARVVWSDHKATGCVFVETLSVDLFRRTLRSDDPAATVITGPWKPQAA
jgi:hypothetical protein